MASSSNLKITLAVLVQCTCKMNYQPTQRLAAETVVTKNKISIKFLFFFSKR
jgi:hypothetical protein